MLKNFLLSTLGLSVFAVIVIMWAIKHYSKIKLILSDIYKALSFLGKWFRKQSVSNEVEATLNGAINDFNKNFENDILPNCKIEWVTPENQKNILIENRAIVCLSFDKRDHHLNFYNATFNFVQTALVAKAKPFIKQTTKKAIDLLSTKIILRQYRREILGVFNSKFSEFDIETKEVYYRLDETDENSLFSPFLLPEIHHLGELLYEKTPTSEIENEIENFLDWFYELSTRELDDKTNLRFESSHLKIGVILIAKLSTYENWGAEAYTKWAEKYASENYNAVYLLSKGKHRQKIAEDVAQILVESKGFDQLTKKTSIKKVAADGSQLLVTCICLRPNPAVIRYNAWEFIERKFVDKEKVIGIIEVVKRDSVVVNVSGLKIAIPNSNLSATKIPNATRIFKEEQELELDIILCDQQNDNIELANIGTQTDPKQLIEANLGNEMPVSATVIRVQRDKESFDKGLMVRADQSHLNIFIPRSKMTFSRFADISKLYTEGDKVEVVLEEFNYGFGNYIGRLNNLSDPWKSIVVNFQIGTVVKAVVKEIQERHIICEISEGLECKLLTSEISWNEEECDSNKFNVEENLDLKITYIDIDNRKILVSLRKLSISPAQEIFNRYQNQIIQGTITSVDDDNGVYFENSQININGYVYWRELAWCNVSPISQNFHTGDGIAVKVISYDPDYDSVKFSVKQVLTHQYLEFMGQFRDRDYLEGSVIKHYKSISAIEILYKGLTIQGYVHKSEISNCCYINDDDIAVYLPIGERFHFVLKRYDDRLNIIELSRKIFLKENKEVQLGDSYQAYYTKSNKGKNYFYSDYLEGFFVDKNRHFNANETLEVIPVNSNDDEFDIV